jgi:hypothetical protein
VKRGVPYLKLRAKKNETPKEIITRWVNETSIWLGGIDQ